VGAKEPTPAISDQTNTVSAINAFLFIAMGSGMGVLPVLVPSWFPPTGADEASTRALWLELMAAVQIGLGLAFLVRERVVPFAGRLVSAIRASDTGAVALSKSRGVPGR
jgi:hypothetical protein